MDIHQADYAVLRQLGARKAELAALPIQNARREQWRRLNDLERSEPLVWINEIPWHEMDGGEELALCCQHPLARAIENVLRQELYQWEHMQGDMIVEPVVYAPLAVTDDGFGLAIEENIIQQGAAGGIHSHQYLPQIRGMDDIAKLRPTTVAHDAAESRRRLDILRQVFDGILPVASHGLSGIWFAPWDQLVTWTGVTEVLTDMAMRPDYVHALIGRYIELLCDKLDQYERLGVLSLNNTSIRVGSGAYGHTRALPSADYQPGRVRAHDLWTGSAPQIFAAVSPEMHYEFALQYDKRWMDRFGLVYYGCCEPYHRKIDMLRAHVPNLRKISCSPACDTRAMCGQVGRDYAVSLKPNPACLAADRFRADIVRADLDERLRQTAGCNVEIVLKDISTVRNDPRRLWQWAEIAVAAARAAGARG